MSYKFIKKTVDLFKADGNFDEREFRGCSKTRIKSLEEFLPPLYPYIPEAYYEFLTFGGNGICDILYGTDFFFPQVYAMRRERKVHGLKKMGFFSKNFEYERWLGDELFLFYYHKGCFARFFHLNESDDPEVYYYEPGISNVSLVRQNQSFSQYLFSEVQHFLTRYNSRIKSIDEELHERIKHYRKGLLDILEQLDALPLYECTKFSQEAKTRYTEILRNTYRLLLGYRYFKLHDYECIFPVANYMNIPWCETSRSGVLLERMRELESEARDLTAYTCKLKNGTVSIRLCTTIHYKSMQYA